REERAGRVLVVQRVVADPVAVFADPGPAEPLAVRVPLDEDLVAVPAAVGVRDLEQHVFHAGQGRHRFRAYLRDLAVAARVPALPGKPVGEWKHREIPLWGALGGRGVWKEPVDGRR